MANKQPTKHWKLDDDMIPSHDLCIKMLKKYPELNASYDGAMILNDGEYFTEDFIHGLWIESKDVPWAKGWEKHIKVFDPPCYCGSAVPKGRIYVYRGEVKWKELPHDYCSSENMDLNEKAIDEFMSLIYEARKLEKEIAVKAKVKEIKEEFKKPRKKKSK